MRAHVAGPGHVAFAVAVAGLGVLNLVYGDFAPQWQSVPPWFPWPHGLAYVSGVVLLVGAVGLLVGRTAASCATLLAAYLLVWAAVRAADLVANPASMERWYALAEALGPALGGVVLGASLARPSDPAFIASLGGKRSLRIARVLFGASCIVFGLAHFAYADFTARMVPAWLPARRALAYATGAAHAAAGLGLVSSVLARLAATLEALMLSAFVLLVHVPSLGASPPPAWAPSNQARWTELLLALVMAGSAGIVARSLRARRVE
jgi:uncharacterized membrane protein